LPWLRDEQWQKEQRAKLVALDLSSGAIGSTLVETYAVDAKYTAKIWAFTLGDGSKIYKVGFVVHSDRPNDADDWGSYGAKPGESQGWMGARYYESVEDARENVPDELARAHRLAGNRFTTTDRRGETKTWTPYLFPDDKLTDPGK
jgi:hypothetical protein